MIHDPSKIHKVFYHLSVYNPVSDASRPKFKSRHKVEESTVYVTWPKVNIYDSNTTSGGECTTADSTQNLQDGNLILAPSSLASWHAYDGKIATENGEHLPVWCDILKYLTASARGEQQ